MAEPPQYFREFLKHFDDSTKCLRDDIGSLRSEVAEYKQLLLSERTRLDAHIEKVQSIDSRVLNIETRLGATAPQPLVDSREILISGIPSNATTSREKALESILEAIGLPNFSSYVMGLRDWTSLKFVSPSARDDVMNASPKLRDVTCQSLFKIGGNSRIYLRALWPKQLHELLSLAITASKRLNYARPVVQNLTVFMRKMRNCTLIPIFSPADLEVLKPHSSQ